MATNLKTVAYQPVLAPTDGKGLPTHIDTELRRIAAALRLIADGHVDPTYVEPTKPRDGDFRLADGANWDPGSGQGAYIYYASTWNPLGIAVAPTTFRAPLTNVAPATPVEGDIALADGTGWNPGSGKGFYGYYTGAWHFLG